MDTPKSTPDPNSSPARPDPSQRERLNDSEDGSANVSTGVRGVLRMLPGWAATVFVFTGFAAVVFVTNEVLDTLSSAQNLVGSHASDVDLLHKSMEKGEAVERIAAGQALTTAKLAANATFVQICAFGIAAGFLLTGFTLSVFGVRAATQYESKSVGLRLTTASPGIVCLFLAAWITSQSLDLVVSSHAQAEVTPGAEVRDSPATSEAQKEFAPPADVQEIFNNPPTY